MNEVVFSDKKNGYDKSQVDEYIKKITDAYQGAYNENVAMREKYDSLLADYKKLEAQNRQKAQNEAEIVAKALIEGENVAKKIIAKARSEEAKIMDLAAKSLESAYFALERAMDAVGLEAQKLFVSVEKKEIENGGGEKRPQNDENNENPDGRETEIK